MIDRVVDESIDGIRTIAIAMGILVATGATAVMFREVLEVIGFGGMTTGTSGILVFIVAFVGGFAMLFGAISLWYARAE